MPSCRPAKHTEDAETEDGMPKIDRDGRVSYEADARAATEPGSAAIEERPGQDEPETAPEPAVPDAPPSARPPRVPPRAAPRRTPPPGADGA